MAYQRVPDTAEIVVRYTLDGYDLINTYHAAFAGGYAQANLDALALNIDLTPVSGLLADQSQYLTYISTDVRGLDAENDLTSSNASSASPGGQAAGSMPGNVAFCVQRLSGLTGRSARGRVFVAGIPILTAFFDANTRLTLSATAANAYLAHIDAFRTTINAVAGWRAVIVSRTHNKIKRDEAVTFDWVTSAYKDRKLDTIRKRISN